MVGSAPTQPAIRQRQSRPSGRYHDDGISALQGEAFDQAGVLKSTEGRDHVRAGHAEVTPIWADVMVWLSPTCRMTDASNTRAPTAAKFGQLAHLCARSAPEGVAWLTFQIIVQFLPCLRSGIDRGRFTPPATAALYRLRSRWSRCRRRQFATWNGYSIPRTSSPRR